MLQRKLLMRALSVLLSATMCFPAVAAESVAAKLKSNPRTAVELQMQADGTIRGKVVDRQGKSLTNAKVNVVSKDGQAVALTDANGMFAVQGMTVGEYMIGIGKRTQKVRVWNTQTAPPNTAQLALLVVGDTVRGQCCAPAADCCAPAAPACGAPAADCCAPAAPACGAPAADCCAPAAPACGAPAADCCAPAAPACGAPAADCCAPAAPSCGAPADCCAAGPSCGGCDSCGGGCGIFGGGGCGLFGGGAGGAGALGAGAGPIVIGGAVAAAIAIPLALDDDDDAS